MDEVIRIIEVEFLRPGPPHNQLLSPLTRYLAVCGDAGAGTVTVPFEQAAFNRRLSNLRYQLDDEEDTLRLETLRTTGTDLGAVLDGVPGLVGSLTERAGGEGLINLRIVSSASELALLPFELAKVPSGTGRPSDEWLALRAGTPICITRKVRSIPPTQQEWPRTNPKVLFVVGLGIRDSLVKEHRKALEEALSPWKTAEQNPLVILESDEADLSAIRDELLKGVTSVHLLAHGAEAEGVEGDRFGLLLKGLGKSEGDVITGERFASVFRSLPATTQMPSAIAVASCDSAYQADVLIPGGSFARALHLLGIPLVVASQFPLTEDGSARLTELLYEDILWGKNPLPAIARARAALHAEAGHTHDWASLVVYDALPLDLAEQLEEVRYHRARNAINAALKELDDGSIDVEEAKSRAGKALDRLPTSAGYALESGGLKASYEKRLSKFLYDQTVAEVSSSFLEARVHLESAHQQYRDAADQFLLTGSGAGQGANLHWLETQAISLDHILGSEPPEGAWSAALRSAQLGLDHAGGRDRAWANGSLAELMLLKLFDESITQAQRAEAGDKACEYAAAILEDFPFAKDFPVRSTKRQIQRYVEWWGPDAFNSNLDVRERSPRWPEVVEAASRVVVELDRAVGAKQDVQS